MKENNNSILLVEGKDDRHVIYALLMHYQVPETFSVIDCDGIDNLLRELTLRLTNPLKYKSIGVVIDADVDIKRRFDVLRNILLKTGKYDLSKVELSSTGMSFNSTEETYPLIGVWLMPNNMNSGMLEDFVMTLADENDKMMKEAEAVLCSIEERRLNRYTSVHRSKAKIHTYLAWQEEPGKPMGQAITAKVLDANAKSAKVFVEWIQHLFS